MKTVQPKTPEDFLEIFRLVTPTDYHQAIEDDPGGSIALVRAAAKMFALVAAYSRESSQSRFFLPYPTQTAEEATGPRYATFSIDMSRSSMADLPIVVADGAMVVVGLNGRRYRNVGPYEWAPYVETAQTLLFECEVPGTVGNMTHVADADGNLTTTDGDPDVAAMTFANQSYDRTSMNGSINVAVGQLTVITDSGKPNQFVATDVGLYVRIDAAANPANQGRILRILGFSDPGVPDASGLKRRSITVDDSPQRNRLQIATSFDSATEAFTDRTLVANGDSPGTFEPFVGPLRHGDIFYVGSIGGDGPFTSVVMSIDVPADDATTYAILWEYWNGVAWSPLNIETDDSNAFVSTGVRSISWDMPTGWAVNTVAGVQAYYARARIISDFADEFSDGVIDSKWTVAGTGTATESGGDARLLTSGVTDVFLGSAYPISQLQQVTGDFDARLDSWARLTTDLGDLDNTIVPVNQAGLAALMVVDDAVAFAGIDAIVVGVGYANAGTPIRFQRFQRTAGVLGSNTIAGVVHPLTTRGHLRIVRAGQLFTIMVRDYNPAVPLESDAGWQTWTTIDRTATPLPDTVFVGPGTCRSGGAFQMLARSARFVLDQPTAEPTVGQVYTLNPDPLVTETGTVTWSILDWRELGLAMDEIEAPSGGRDDDLGMLASEHGVFRRSDETDDQYRERASRLGDVITPNAWKRAINRALEPYGLRGRAVDLDFNADGERFTGAFYDTDAHDYYEPGDANPTDPYKLALSEQEAYGWVFVYLPRLPAIGDSGMAYDGGPTLQSSGSDVFVSAFDQGFFDGVSSGTNAVYASLHDTLNKIRGGFIGFTMLLDESLNTPC